jgi:hypothetical protein
MIRRILIRLAVVAVLAVGIGALLGRIARSVEREDAAPAGFARGLAQGALMPLAMPYLLFGRDLPIYAPRNTGRTYKLGYTVGVNGCGAIFFGVLFWRLNRLRRRLESHLASRGAP